MGTPSPKASAVTIADLPYLAWKDILSKLSIADKLSLYSTTSAVPFLQAYADSWRRFRVIARRYRGIVSRPNPQPQDFIVDEEQIIILKNMMHQIDANGLAHQHLPSSQRLSDTTLCTSLAHVVDFTMFLLERTASYPEAELQRYSYPEAFNFQLFASLLENLDGACIRSLNICLAENKASNREGRRSSAQTVEEGNLFEMSDLVRVVDCVKRLGSSCRNICITRWPATTLKGCAAERTAILPALMNPMLVKLERLCLGWFDYSDPEYWAIAHYGLKYQSCAAARNNAIAFGPCSALLSWLWKENQVYDKENIHEAVRHFKSLKELAIGDVCSGALLQILADRERAPLETLSLMIKRWQKDEWRPLSDAWQVEKAWDAVRETNAELKVDVTIAEDIDRRQYDLIFGELVAVHSLHFLPATFVYDEVLDVVRSRFSTTLVTLSLHQEELDFEDISRSCLQLVRTSKNLTKFVYASTFSALFAFSLLRARGSGWRQLTLFEDKLLDPNQKNEIEMEGRNLLQRPWGLNEGSKRSQGPKSYNG